MSYDEIQLLLAPINARIDQTFRDEETNRRFYLTTGQKHFDDAANKAAAQRVILYERRDEIFNKYKTGS